MPTSAGPTTERREVAASPGPQFGLNESKLRPPWTRPGLVTRTSLVDRLLAADAPIVAVVAPAGYGKTTLLSQWSGRTDKQVAWVSLDERDNDPAVCLSYMAAALNRVESIDPTVLRSLASPAGVELASTLHRLVVEVSAMRAPFALVLDHVEVLGDQRCRDVVAELALNMPPGSQLAVASRIEPPLPMARLRAGGRVVDVGIEDLAMEHAEAAELVAAAGAALADADLGELVRRTEGWPVGLYLAALAMKDGGPLEGVGRAFAGDDRLIADYLRSEVLGHLSPGTSAFLVRTSVLDRLCGPLCDAVLGTRGSQQILESLERSMLLVVPLDRRREWYRCHHLLRDLLRAELVRSEPQLVGRLHDRAATWFEANGHLDLAIDHAQAADDADRAARLFAGLAQPTFAAGRVDTLLHWLGWFEARGLIDRYPHVAMLGALIEALQGHPAGAARWAEAAESGSFDGLLPDGSPIDAWMGVLRAALLRRGVAGMRDDAALALRRLAPGSPWVGPASFGVAMSHVLDGDGDAADPILAETVELCQRRGAMPAAAAALAERAVVAIARDDWARADAFSSQAVTIVRDGHLDGYLYSTVVHAVAARTAVRRGNIEQGKEFVVAASRGRPLCSAAMPISTQFLLQLAHAHLELADPAGARAVLRQIRDILLVRPDVGTVAAQADELERRLATIRVGPLGASSLTTAELRLLPLLATHLSYAEIGERLFVSRNTVKTHAAAISRKLDVSSRSEAVRVAAKIGLLGR